MRVQIVTFLQLGFLCLLLAVSIGGLSGCASDRTPVRGPDRLVKQLEVTGYCKCGKCCGWKRNWFGRPVFASGSQKGKAKKVGITANGTKARVGTIAADTSVYPFGTTMYIPGYGYGVVEDRGGAIKGQRLDLYFDTHQQALHWGRRKTDVKVWFPRK